MQTFRYEISPKYAHLEAFLLHIKEHFATSTQSIHRARNELKLLSSPDSELSLVVKSFKTPNLLRRVIYTFFRAGKAKTSYHNALKLQAKEVQTPDPIGYIEFYENSLLKESFFITPQWHYDVTIREPLLDHQFPQRTACFEAFSHFVATMHQHNIYHKDLSPGNILIRKETMQLCVVDINRISFTPLSLSQKLKNFSKLWADDDDLKTIVRAYAHETHIDVNKAIEEALEDSHRHKKFINLKKRYRAFWKKMKP